jgi:hypothetical protein
VKGSHLSFAVVAVGLLGLAGGGVAQTEARAAKPDGPVRTQLLGHVNPGGSAYTADVVARRGYAYLGSWRGAGGACPSAGVRVFSLANPRLPKHVATFADGASEPDVRGTWTEKTIVRHVQTASFTGDLAVTSFQSCAAGSFRGFGLYDVTNPAQPRRLALVHLDPRGSHEIWLAAARRHAWVYTAIPLSELLSAPDYDPKTGTASTPGQPDFRIFDVTDPAKPRQVGAWGAWRKLGIRPTAGRGFLPANFVHSVITNPQATRAFLSYWDLGTVILDIRQPANPRYLGRTGAHDAEGDAHSAWLAKGGKVLIETHEDGLGRPYFFDISNQRRPRLLSKFGSLTNGDPRQFVNGVHDPKVLGNRAYFSWYSRGVVIADISKPSRPRLLTRFVPRKTTDSAHGLCDSPCTMTWGVFPTKSYVLAADMISGLWVFRVR